MDTLMNLPMVILLLTFIGLWGFAWIGAWLGSRMIQRGKSLPEEYGMVVSATLTLMGLLIGFSFSMAISRYDLRKNYEEEEANAIGTEYVRADLLPDSVRQRVQEQLLQYLELRIRKYQAHPTAEPADIAVNTAQLQNEMWKEVKDAALAAPGPISATVVVGMNDVINRQGYAQAARWNRIPRAAWALMMTIALLSNFLIGYGERGLRRYLFLIVPLVIAISFLLIADIDSPRGGLIRVSPQNLNALADTLKPR